MITRHSNVSTIIGKKFKGQGEIFEQFQQMHELCTRITKAGYRGSKRGNNPLCRRYIKELNRFSIYLAAT